MPLLNNEGIRKLLSTEANYAIDFREANHSL